MVVTRVASADHRPSRWPACRPGARCHPSHPRPCRLRPRPALPPGDRRRERAISTGGSERPQVRAISSPRRSAITTRTPFRIAQRPISRSPGRGRGAGSAAAPPSGSGSWWGRAPGVVVVGTPAVVVTCPDGSSSSTRGRRRDGGRHGTGHRRQRWFRRTASWWATRRRSWPWPRRTERRSTRARRRPSTRSSLRRLGCAASASAGAPSSALACSPSTNPVTSSVAEACAGPWRLARPHVG